MKKLLLIALLVVGCVFGREYIAIIDFEGINVSEGDARALTQRLTSEMISLEVYQIVERSEMKRLLDEQKFQYSGCVDLKCAVEIGKMIGAKYMVVGSISKLGNVFSVDSRMISVETGESYISAQYTLDGGIETLLIDGMASISHQLCDLPYKEKIVSSTISKSSLGYGALLEITSDPIGADIYIGGNYFDTTPKILENFPTGDYNIEIRYQGYNTYNKKIRLNPKDKKLISSKLVCTIIDCNGICNGSALLDDCGICDGDYLNWNGSTYSNGKCDCNFDSVLDDCGICDSDPSNDCNIQNKKNTPKKSFIDKTALSAWVAFITIILINSPSL